MLNVRGTGCWWWQIPVCFPEFTRCHNYHYARSKGDKPFKTINELKLAGRRFAEPDSD